jgi:hypothetical protein
MVLPFPEFLLEFIRFFHCYEHIISLHALVCEDIDVVEPFPFQLFVSCWTAFKTVIDIYNVYSVYTPVQLLIRDLCVFEVARGNGVDVWSTIVFFDGLLCSFYR